MQTRSYNILHSFLVLLIFVLGSRSLQAQEQNCLLSIKIPDALPTSSKLAFVVAGTEVYTYTPTIDSATSTYLFSIPKPEIGFYRFTFGENVWHLYLLFTTQHNTVTIQTLATDPLTSASVSGAPECNAYWEALRAKESYQDAIWGLRALKKFYAPEEYETLRNTVQQQYISELTAIREKANNHLVNQLLFFFRTPRDTIFSHWWTDTLAATPIAAASPEFVGYVQAYLKEFWNNEYSYSDQLIAYYNAIKPFHRLKFGSMGGRILRNLLEYTFAGGVYDQLIDTIAKYQIGGAIEPVRNFQKEEHHTEKLLKVRVKDIDEKKILLIDKNTPYTLLILWSVSCPHCQALMPKLWDVCKDLPKKIMAIRAIAIDKDTPLHRTHIRSHQWGWSNIIEYDDGNSAILEALNADGTPELFLIDKNGRLIARPSDNEQLYYQLLQLGIK